MTDTTNLIYLGNFGSVDTYEGDYDTEYAGSLVGVSVDHTQAKVVTATIYDNDYDGVMEDDECNPYCDYVSYNTGSGTNYQYTDSTMTAMVTLTLKDGSTLSVEAVMMQMQNGDLFISDLLNCGTLDNLEISAIEIASFTGTNYSGWYTNQSVDNTVICEPDPVLDGTVEGSGGNDVIDVAYTGDPEGDMVDNNDAILAGDTGDDDLIYAYGGDDVVRAGDGDDEVYGGYGNDTIYGEAGEDFILAGNGADEVYGGADDDTLCGQDGNDLLYGGTGNDILEGMNNHDTVYGDGGNDVLYGDGGYDSLVGGSGNDIIYGGTENDVICGDGPDNGGDVLVGKALVWEQLAADGTQLGSSINYDAGGINVNVGFQAQDEWAMASISNSTVYTETGEGFDGDSSLKLFGEGGEGGWDNTSQTTLNFSSTSSEFQDEVQNVAFRINDVDLSTVYGDDHIDRLTIRAYDADGNLVSVSITSETGDQVVNGNQATGDIEHNAGVTPGSAEGSILINIAGPVAKVVIDYDNGGWTDQIVHVTDVTFDAVSSASTQGPDGNDLLFGGAGDDIIEGKGGDDTITGGAGDDVVDGGDDRDYIYGGAGDNVDGGTGGDDYDTLDLTGQGPFYIANETVDADGDSTSGTIVFVDGNGDPTGETLVFTEIEQIIGDEINRGPNANDDAITVDEDSGPTTIDVLGNDSDPDGDTLTITDASVPADQGSVAIVNGELVFTPAENFNGEATITYTVSDGNGGTDTATVTVTVNPVNDGPVANDDVATTDEDTPVTIDVLGNDTDVDGDDLTITDASVPADQGSVEIVNGELVFTPADDFSGEATITYTVSDGNGGTDTATVTVTVNPVNDGPDAVDGSDTTDEDTPVTVDLLANDTDPEDDPLTVTSATLISGEGEIVDNGDGTVTFTPADNWTGEAVIEYTISDGNGGTDTAQHTITVTPVDDAPVANDDAAETDEDTPVTIDVLDNDSDPDGDDLTVTEATSPNGDVTINADGTITFTPDENFDGDTTITYTVTDPDGNTDTATVTVTVNPVNDAPEANDDSDTTDFNTPVTVDLLANDTDVDGDDLTVVEATVPADQGTLVNNGDGTVTFTPAPGFTGEATISYTIRDEEGLTDSAIHTITVGDAPLDGTVNGTDGNDIIDGGYLGDPEGDRVDNNDEIIPGHGPNDDLIEAYGGDDTILAGQGNDTVYGGDGNDSILGQAGNDTLYGEAGEDTITGGQDNETIFGGADNDVLDGDSGHDSIEGNEGDDSILGGGGDDIIRGGTGNDTIDGENNDDMIFGGAGDDDLSGGYGDDKIEGGSGNDTLDGGAGNDDLWGASGDDTVYGGTGHDTIATAEGNDEVYGGDGNDIIDTANDENPLNGQNLPDQAYPGLYPADLDPNDDLDTVYGGAGNDSISTGDDNDTIFGGEGRDVIDAGIDDDLVYGGADNDTVIGSEGNDEIYGEDGDDTIYGGLVPGGPGDDLNLPDDLDGDGDSNDPGEDLVTDNNFDTLYGGAGNDTIYGADDDDTLYGGTGNDYLDGGVDDDVIEGGEGEDTIIGGQGEDDMFGGLGSDTFLGGNGGDHVVGGEDPDLDGDGQSDETDVLDLTGSGVDYIDYVDGDPEAGTVHFLDGTTMTFEEIENVIPCFTPGTTIATPRGERLVEELREGDRIITRDNGIQEIRWVGRKEMSGKQLVKNPHLKPILVKAGALGNGLPERDMLVSPNHRMLVANDMTQLYFEEREVLAAAKHLVGTNGIHAVDVMNTTYIHFMFDRHEVVLSNGAWTESFQPGDYSLKGIGNSQRNEIFELFPELASKPGLEGYQAARRALKKHEAKLLVK